jgi:Effector-associated domain 11
MKEQVLAIKNLIAAGDLLAAISALKTIAGTPVDDIIVLESRFNQNERKERQGTISVQDYNLERNQITKALLAISSELEVSTPLKGAADKTTIDEKLARLEAVQTGGDTFCYCMLYFFDFQQNIARQFAVIKVGDFTLYDLRYRVVNMQTNKDVGSWQHGELNSPADYPPIKWGLQGSMYLRFFFNARNGAWHQDLILKKSVSANCWLAATMVKGKNGRDVIFEYLDPEFEKEFGPPVWKH